MNRKRLIHMHDYHRGYQYLWTNSSSTERKKIRYKYDITQEKYYTINILLECFIYRNIHLLFSRMKMTAFCNIDINFGDKILYSSNLWCIFV